MSCDALAFSAMLWLASTSPAAAPSPQPAAVAAPSSVAGEALFADIVRRAAHLKAQADGYRHAGLDGDLAALAGYAGFKAGIVQLADLDMQGHVLLKDRGTDGDLKCILRGISQDLPVKLHELEAATTSRERDMALREMTYLLNDNVEVITSPPAPPA